MLAIFSVGIYKQRYSIDHLAVSNLKGIDVRANKFNKTKHWNRLLCRCYYPSVTTPLFKHFRLDYNILKSVFSRYNISSLPRPSAFNTITLQIQTLGFSYIYKLKFSLFFT